MLLEVIATTVWDAITAERNGADRIELITGISEGGLTPSLGLIEEVRAAVSIPVRVMVRPHARSFIYDDSDIAVMRRDIRHIAAVGGLSIVMGMLRPDGRIDEKALEVLLEEAAGLPVTFHRAFDEVADQLEALEVLLRYPQITDILTSGGRPTAPEGAERLAVLERLTSGQPLSILAGSGLTAAGLRDFVRDTGVHRVHFGSAVREQGDPLRPVDSERVSEIRAILRKLRSS
jgi:copper homeostasis protein